MKLNLCAFGLYMHFGCLCFGRCVWIAQITASSKGLFWGGLFFFLEQWNNESFTTFRKAVVCSVAYETQYWVVSGINTESEFTWRQTSLGILSKDEPRRDIGRKLKFRNQSEAVQPFTRPVHPPLSSKFLFHSACSVPNWILSYSPALQDLAGTLGIVSARPQCSFGSLRRQRWLQLLVNCLMTPELGKCPNEICVLTQWSVRRWFTSAVTSAGSVRLRALPFLTQSRRCSDAEGSAQDPSDPWQLDFVLGKGTCVSCFASQKNTLITSQCDKMLFVTRKRPRQKRTLFLRPAH